MYAYLSRVATPSTTKLRTYLDELYGATLQVDLQQKR